MWFPEEKGNENTKKIITIITTTKKIMKQYLKNQYFHMVLQVVLMLLFLMYVPLQLQNQIFSSRIIKNQIGLYYTFIALS